MASCVSWPTVRIPVPTTVSDPAASECVSETSASVSADTSSPPVAVVGSGTRGGALLETLERQFERRNCNGTTCGGGGGNCGGGNCSGGNCTGSCSCAEGPTAAAAASAG